MTNFERNDTPQQGIITFGCGRRPRKYNPCFIRG